LNKRTCRTCAYFQPQEEFGEYGIVYMHYAKGTAGECRLNPPVVALTYQGGHDRSGVAVWPIVMASWWCGRHCCQPPAPTGSPYDADDANGTQAPCRTERPETDGRPVGEREARPSATRPLYEFRQRG